MTKQLSLASRARSANVGFVLRQLLFAISLAAGYLCMDGHTALAQELYQGADSAGFRTRVGYIAGETVGRLESLTHFEFMPYVRTENGLMFGDARVFTSDGEVGTNLGLGYRTVVPELNRAFGGILWYDTDSLSGEDASQITVSLESYGPTVDVLGNIYIPIGDDNIGNLTASNARFVGNQLLFDQSGVVGDVMAGGDVQVGWLLPGQFAEDNQIRAFAGAYHYSGSTVDDITGFLARIEGSFLDLFDAQVKVTNDDEFGTNVLFGISIGISAGQRAGFQRVAADSLMRYPTRQYNAVVVRDTVNETGVAAVNPNTGAAYTFNHIAAGATGGDGSSSSPFGSFAAGLADPADYHIVEGDSIFTGTDAEVALSDGQNLIGLSDGFQHELNVRGIGSLTLPTTPGTAAPVLRGTSGDTVQVAANSTFRGFTIENSGGSGVVLDGANGALVSEVSVLNATDEGVLIQNISGSVSVLDTTVNTMGSSAMTIDSVTGSVLATGSYTNTAGQALAMNNIGTDASIDLIGATFANDTGNGMMFNEVGGNIALSGVSLVDSAGAGIQIDGGTGTLRFIGTTTIEGATGDAISIANSDADVVFESLVINGAAGSGISLFNNANTGSFTVVGDTTINGVTGQGIAIRDNESTVTFGSVEIDGRDGIGILVDNTAGQVGFEGDVTIANSQNSTKPGLKVSDSEGDVVFVGDASIQNARGDAGIKLVDNSGRVGFTSLNVDAINATGIKSRSGGQLTMLEGSVKTEGAAAFDIEDALLDVDITSVEVTGGDTGVRLKDTTGSFIVNGDAENTEDSGGFIKDTDTAVSIENAGVVGLRNVSLEDNAAGIQLAEVGRFTLWTSEITGSTGLAIDATNVGTFQVVGSNFSGNGQTFRFAGSDVDTATSWLLSDVTVEAGDANALTLIGSNEATLDLTVSDSTFTSTASNVSLLDITTDGRATFAMSGSRLQSSGSNVVLLDIDSQVTDDLFTGSVINNLFSPTGSSGTGFRLATADQSTVLFDQNTVTFAADRGIGLDLDLGESAVLGIYRNVITDNFDGATAVLIRHARDESQIEIIGNELNFANLGGLSDRGFIFDSVTGDVQLIGNTDNTVNGASEFYSIPTGTTTGSFLINGGRVPQ